MLENFNNRDGDDKMYKTEEKSCYCSFALKYCAPCQHLLFFRERTHRSIYDKELFHMKYYIEKKELCIHDTETNVTDGFPRLDIDLDSNTSDTEIPIIGNLSNPISMEEKYAYYSPILNRISDLLQRFGTEQTKKYAKELLQVEERIRFGKAIFPETQTKDTSGVSLEDTNDYVQLDLNNIHYITKTDILEDDTGSV